MALREGGKGKDNGKESAISKYIAFIQIDDI
jgi:hypothetical protein